MGFFNDLGKKTTETTSKIAKEAKIKIKMSDNKCKIENLYSEIGKKVYQKHLQEQITDEDLINDLTNIDTLATEIENAKIEILKLNQKKKCVKCHEEIANSSQFCPKCGEKQTEEQPVVEIKQEKIVKAEEQEIQNVQNEQNEQEQQTNSQN